jgi:transcriptional regulator with XRE-family HTH domain
LKEKFKVINPLSKNIVRDTEICIRVASNIPQHEIAKEFGISRQRVSEIYRLYISHLISFLTATDQYEISRSTKLCKLPNALEVFKQYKEFLFSPEATQ